MELFSEPDFMFRFFKKIIRVFMLELVFFRTNFDFLTGHIILNVLMS